MSNEELALKIKAGDDSLQEKLWEQISDLIAWYVRRYRIRNARICEQLSLDDDDFMQVGYFAMMGAVNDYSEESPYKFTSLLTRHIQSQFDSLTGVRNLASKAKESRNIQKSLLFSASLDYKLGDDEDSSTYGDVIPDPRAAEEYERIEEDDYRQKLRIALDNALQTLPERQEVCVRQFYLDNKTQQQIAEALGISQSYVRSMIQTGLLSMRT